MNKLLFLLLLSFSLFSQEKNNTINKHEVKGNLLLAPYAIEVSYEYLLNNKSSIGMFLTLPYTKNRQRIIYMATPYYRYFTGKKYAQGFFIEGFGMLISERKLERLVEGTTTYYANTAKTYTAIGAGIGGKFLFKKNIIAEINIGLGSASRNDVGLWGLIPRAGISIGKRF